MEIICKLSEEIEVALALLSDEERKLVLQRFAQVDSYAVQIDIKELWEAELITPECDIERVKRLAAAYRLLAVDDGELGEARAFLRRAQSS